jgi:predicted MFS family arabinose efflux permease
MKEKRTFGRTERWAIALLFLANIFLFAEQKLMMPNLTQIARDFGFNELQRDTLLGGRIDFGYWAVGGIAALFVGYLTDKMSRMRIFASITLLGMVSCVLSAFAQNYEQLFVCRALAGISLGGAIPVTYSLVGDYFAPQNRAKAISFILLSNGLGAGLGQSLAGSIHTACPGSLYGWRVSFALASIPCMVIALLFLFTVKEPMRGRTEESLRELIEKGQAYTFKIRWKDYRVLFRIRSNLLLFLNILVGVVPWCVFFVFINDFLAEDKGYGVHAATLMLAAAGGGATLGSIISGFMGSFFYTMKSKYLPLYFAVTTTVGIVPAMAFLNRHIVLPGEEPQILLPGLIAFVMGVLMSQDHSPVRTILLNVNAPETRGSVFSLFNLVNNLGQGLGPVIVSSLIVLFGKQPAFHITVLFWLPAAAVAFLLIWTFPRDEAQLGELLARRAREM